MDAYYRKRIQQEHQQRMLDMALEKQCSGLEIHIKRIFDVIAHRIIPYFKQVFKGPNDISIERLSEWLENLFTEDSNMKVDHAIIVVDDALCQFAVFAILSYKTAKAPMLILG